MSTMEVIKTMSEIKDLVDNIDTFVPQGAPKIITSALTCLDCSLYH